MPPVYAIIGSSGSGKTTLIMYLISRLAERLKVAARVLGFETEGRGIKAIAQDIARAAERKIMS
jgi:ABC-type multidrug transport system ATPase subunit